jgi:hypothetical protein
MEATVLELVLKRFDNADETREFEKGKFELINIGGMTIGRATYNAGWKWSAHVGKALGKKSCDVEHGAWLFQDGLLWQWMMAESSK